MADLFELWRLMCVTALSRRPEQLAEAVPEITAASPPSQPDAIDLSAFPTLGCVRIELATMLLLEQREQARSHVPAVLIVAPYAVHDASIADFALKHSVAQILSEAGPGFIALTFWKSATAAMRDYEIDAYLSDLNVAIDDLGGRASLVGLREGGWLAAVYAARFPRKVARLLTVSPAMIEQLMALAGVSRQDLAGKGRHKRARAVRRVEECQVQDVTRSPGNGSGHGDVLGLEPISTWLGRWIVTSRGYPSSEPMRDFSPSAVKRLPAHE